MAFNFNPNEVENQNDAGHPDPLVEDRAFSNDTVGDFDTNSNTKPIRGLSSEELKDPNKISVEIADKSVPIVLLFGPPACGKTMTLVRLTRYLANQGYSVSPVRSFRPSYDANYDDICNSFNEMMNQDDAAKSTTRISFMLAEVAKNGRTICQLLEAPGEHYFDPKNPNQEYPRYIRTIINVNCRKIWGIFVEPNYLDPADRNGYVSKIRQLRTNMGRQDRAILIYNKIDKTKFLINRDGQVHLNEAMKDVRNMYNGILEPFKNDTPISRWFTPYRIDFVPFQTGNYNVALDGSVSYTEGPDAFPRILWNLILKRVRG